MTYIVTVEKYGRKEQQTDLQRFAKDLSKALGGGEVIPNQENYDDECFASFRLGSDLINLYGNRYGSKGRVSVSIRAPDIKHDEFNSYAKEHRTESAHVSPDARSIEQIAKDIRKRVVDASQEALRLQREYAAQKRAGRNNLATHIERLSQAAPYLQVRRQNDRELTASVHGGTGAYFSGSLDSTGAVSIHHISSMSIDKFVRVMAILNEKEG